jgi:2-methylisocitrate lyase-like PEP mutase family enzyme
VEAWHAALVPTQSDKAAALLALHQGPGALLFPNPWDAGIAKLLASLGFSALATTSSGFAATLGQLDGSVTRDQAIAHAATIVEATELPVSADLENGYVHEPEAVAETIELALAAGLAGCSIEDFTGDAADPIYDLGLATERIEAAAEAAHKGDVRLVLTARAENHLHGRDDLADTITRLQAYQAAGADVLYAPGLHTADTIRQVVNSVDLPVNVLALPNGPSVAELEQLGVRRISVGGAFAYAALGAVVEAGRELLDEGTYGYWDRAFAGRAAARQAFSPRPE